MVINGSESKFSGNDVTLFLLKIGKPIIITVKGASSGKDNLVILLFL